MNIDLLFEKATRDCGLRLNKPTIVGVSGGPDSLCLMHGLTHLGFSLIVAHFDHQLRPESEMEAFQVKQIASQFGLPVVLGKADVAGFAARQKLSIEDGARTLRYRFLFEQARAHHAQAVAVGHNADDQAETFLMHLLRGAGLSGLVGMRDRNIIESWDPTIPLVRPLLSFWRDEILTYCQEANLSPVIDASNKDTAYFRNRVRHELVPFIEIYNPNARQALWQTASLLAGDEEVIRDATDAAWNRCQARIFEYEAHLTLTPLREMPLGLRRRIMRKAVDCVLGSSNDLDFAAIQRVDRLVTGYVSGQVDVIRGARAYIEQDRLVIAVSGQMVQSFIGPQITEEEEQACPIPGSVLFASGWRLFCEVAEREDLLAWIRAHPPSAWEAYVDADSVLLPVVIRRPRPGDRFQPFGMKGHSMKLSDFWINRKHPRRTRAGWPILAADDLIVWVPGFQPSEANRVRQDSRKAFYFRLERV